MFPVVLLLHAGLATFYAFLLPLWGAVPDEPIHYSHVKYVAENWHLPVINDPFRDLKEYYFVADPAGAAQHGPTYYWSAAVLYRLTMDLTLKQQQWALRLYSVLLGGLMVGVAWWCFRLLFPNEPWVAFTAALLLTLMPHRLLISAVIYADIMAALTSTVAIWGVIRATLRADAWPSWALAGLLLGAAMLTKTSAVLIVPLTIVVLSLRWRQGARSLVGAVARLGAYLGATMMVSGWWLLRSLRLYGELFPTEPKPPGFGWLDVIFDPLFPRVLWMATRGYWLSLWSQVGWLPDWAAPPIYGMLLVATTVTLYALVAGVRGRYRGCSDSHMALLSGFAAMGVAMYYAALQRTILVSFHSNEQTGKHGQTVLVAFIALAAAAWRYLVGTRRVPAVLAAGALLMVVFNVLSVYNLETNLVPRFAPGDPMWGTENLAGWKVKDLPARGIPWVKDRPDAPNRYLIHGQQSYQPPPDYPARRVAQAEAHSDQQQEHQAHHCHQDVTSPRVELHIHGPVCPLVPQEDEGQS
ncbi:MAG: hypothetical protein HPY69_20625 [Armatimonadetes bacterium]|nr:hypothetical protein [Armatimonadota bacterium]